MLNYENFAKSETLKDAAKKAANRFAAKPYALEFKWLIQTANIGTTLLGLVSIAFAGAFLHFKTDGLLFLILGVILLVLNELGKNLFVSKSIEYALKKMRVFAVSFAFFALFTSAISMYLGVFGALSILDFAQKENESISLDFENESSKLQRKQDSLIAQIETKKEAYIKMNTYNGIFIPKAHDGLKTFEKDKEAIRTQTEKEINFLEAKQAKQTAANSNKASEYLPFSLAISIFCELLILGFAGYKPYHFYRVQIEGVLIDKSNDFDFEAFIFQMKSYFFQTENALFGQKTTPLLGENAPTNNANNALVTHPNETVPSRIGFGFGTDKNAHNDPVTPQKQDAQSPNKGVVCTNNPVAKELSKKESDLGFADCSYCEKRFKKRTDTHAFCSNACRNAYHRKTKK